MSELSDRGMALFTPRTAPSTGIDELHPAARREPARGPAVDGLAHSTSLRMRRLGVVASAPLLMTLALIEGASTPGYDPFRDTISRLGSPGQPFAMLAGATFVLYGALVVLGAASCDRHAPGTGRWLRILIGAYGIAGIVTGLAPKDRPGAPLTRASQVHVDATLLGGAAILVGMVLVARCSPASAERRATSAVIALTIAATITFRFTWGTEVYGLVERIVLGLPACWLSGLALTSPGMAPPLGTCRPSAQ